MSFPLSNQRFLADVNLPCQSCRTTRPKEQHNAELHTSQKHMSSKEKLASKEACKQDIAVDFYGFAQTVQFEGDEGVSQPDIDAEEAEAEWKLFRQVIFVQYKSSSLQEVLSPQKMHPR